MHWISRFSELGLGRGGSKMFRQREKHNAQSKVYCVVFAWPQDDIVFARYTFPAPTAMLALAHLDLGMTYALGRE